jgi:hypothetical protein
MYNFCTLSYSLAFASEADWAVQVVKSIIFWPLKRVVKAIMSGRLAGAARVKPAACRDGHRARGGDDVPAAGVVKPIKSNRKNEPQTPDCASIRAKLCHVFCHVLCDVFCHLLCHLFCHPPVLSCIIWSHISVSHRLTEAELQEYFPGPAFLGWHRMSDMVSRLLPPIPIFRVFWPNY